MEKVVKKTIKAEKKNNTEASTSTIKSQKTKVQDIENNYTYDVLEDIDTRDESNIWIVKVKESLSRE